MLLRQTSVFFRKLLPPSSFASSKWHVCIFQLESIVARVFPLPSTAATRRLCNIVKGGKFIASSLTAHDEIDLMLRLPSQNDESTNFFSRQITLPLSDSIQFQRGKWVGWMMVFLFREEDVVKSARDKRSSRPLSTLYSLCSGKMFPRKE